MRKINKITLHANKAALSKIAAVLLIVILIIAIFGGLFLAGVFPKTNPSVREKITKLLKDKPETNPLVPVFFHYLDRYFNGLSSDSFDQAIARVMNGESQERKEIMKNLLNSYKNNYDIIKPSLPEGYELQIGDTVSSLKLARDVVKLGSPAGDSLDQYEDTPGIVRKPDPEEAEFGPVCFIRYINGYSSSDDPVRVDPGMRVLLEGVNFYDPNLHVIIESDPAGYERVLEGGDVLIIGDQDTPISASLDQVHDFIYVDMPIDIPTARFYRIKVQNFEPEQSNSDARSIEVPPPSGEKYTIRARSVYCQDETNGFLGSEAGDDETSFKFIVATGDEMGEATTDKHDYNDGTTVALGPSEAKFFGPADGAYAEIDGTVGIMVIGIEVDWPGDTLQVWAGIGLAQTATIALFAALGVATGWALVVIAIAVILVWVATLFDGPVTIATDFIRWSEDDLYYLTSENRPDWYTVDFVEKKEHPDIVQKVINTDGYDVTFDVYAAYSGFEVRVPVGGNYKFSMNPTYSERLFTVWRGYQNFDEPSQYFVLFEVQRQG